MPTLSNKLTDTLARATPLPVTGYLIHWCPQTPGFGLRVSSTGDKAFVAERRVNGKTTRRTLGKAAGPAGITAEAARRLQVTISSELQQGLDRAVQRREARQAERADTVTLASAIEAYVRGKTNAAGQHLKPRTKADYLAMVAEGGGLSGISHKPMHRISAGDIRAAHAAVHSQRQKTYAMQVLRAVLRWHGVTVPDSPLDKSSAGRDRIQMPASRGNPTPIPAELLAGWWKAASARSGPSADGLRLMLLTGCRPGEIFGSAHAPGLLVRDVDLAGGRMTLPDTKNRTNHVVMLSAQARAIVAANCQGKKASAKVFDVVATGKTLDAINVAAGTPGVTPHKLRHTFASVAAGLVNAFALKRMLNHAGGGDVTAVHYVHQSEAQLLAAWQAVSDFICETP